MLDLLLLWYLRRILQNSLKKMIKSDQIKILDDKIKANNAQYKIDRLNAEISAFSEGELDKYEFLTRKELKYILSGKILSGKIFVGEIFRRGKISSLVKNFVTFPRRKFSPRVKNRVYRVYLFAIRVRYSYKYFS